MLLASFVKRNLGRLLHIYAKKHFVVEISIHTLQRCHFVSASGSSGMGWPDKGRWYVDQGKGPRIVAMPIQ
jgi:hypothetical protein